MVCMQNLPNSWVVWGRGQVFIGKIWGEGRKVCGFLLTDRWWSNRVEVHESGTQPGVTVSTWVDAFSSCRKTQRYCFVYPFQRNGELVLWLQFCFLTAPPLFLHPHPSMMSSCLNLPFGTQGRSRRLNEAITYKWKTGDPERLLYPEGPYRALLSFMPVWPNTTKQKQLNTKAKVKEPDHLWSWVCSSRSHIRLLRWTRHCNRHSRNKDIPSPQGSSLLVCEEMVSPVTDVWSSEWQLRWSDWGLCLLHLWSHASPSACLINRGEKILKFTIVRGRFLHKSAGVQSVHRVQPLKRVIAARVFSASRSHLFDEWARSLFFGCCWLSSRHFLTLWGSVLSWSLLRSISQVIWAWLH